MYKVNIIGAGSIGNHLAHACRNKNWDVSVSDIDSTALNRMKNSIYPERYGKWDENIQLCHPKDVTTKAFDLVIIGTPPDSHLKVALQVLQTSAPRVMLIEKPLCTPDLNGCDELVDLAEKKGTHLCVGYNHTLNAHTLHLESWIKSGKTGEVLTMDACVREYWGGIFAAHPWLSGPSDTYLGFWKRGGGACGEHSHGINNWQHFSRIAGNDRVKYVYATMSYENQGGAEYDSICQIDLETENGFIGRVVQDVVTSPVDKSVSLYCENGVAKWVVNYDSNHDALIWCSNNGEEEVQMFSKKRPDDFKGEIDDIERLLNGVLKESSVSGQNGLNTMMVVAAAHKSARENKRICIDYGKGYNLDALRICE